MIFEVFDQDQSTRSSDEFATMVQLTRSGDKFDMFDDDKSGFLTFKSSARSLRKWALKLNKAFAQKIMRIAKRTIKMTLVIHWPDHNAHAESLQMRDKDMLGSTI